MHVNIKRYKSGKKKGCVYKDEVKIEYGDTWSLDWTLAKVIYPALIELHRVKQGVPYVADSDVPEELRSYNAEPKENDWDIDSLHFKRWDWVVQEMIFAMREIAEDNPDEPSHYTKEGEMIMHPINPETNLGEITFEGYESTPESEKAYKGYHKRIQHGCELLGKYFQALWT